MIHPFHVSYHDYIAPNTPFQVIKTGVTPNGWIITVSDLFIFITPERAEQLRAALSLALGKQL